VGHFTETLWQKAHLRSLFMASEPGTRSKMFPNLFLFIQLRIGCDLQPYSCDTATFVHMHPPEAV